MNLILTVLEIIAPVFILASVGFLWVKLGFEYRIAFVTRMAMTLAVPCLIFLALMEAEIDPSALVKIALASLLGYGLVTLLCLGLVFGTGLSRRTYLAPLIFGNTGNLGLPLALFAFGPEGLSLAVVVFAIMAIYAFTVGIWLVSGGGQPLAVVKEPLVGATILGGIFLINGWRTPAFLTNAIELIGQMAIPLMLITLGVAVARLQPASLGRAMVLSGAKFAICIAGALTAGLWIGLDKTTLAVLILQISTPVAVTSYLLAEKYGADADAVAGLVVASTLLSLITLPLTLAFLV